MDDVRSVTVSESASADLLASGARLAVRISGQSFFTGNEAFKKAAEVANCVKALQESGVAEEHIRLLNVSTEAESGILLRSSAARYLLEVRCSSMDLLGGVLAAIAAQKNARIFAISWEYDELSKTKLEVIKRAVSAAKATADTIAHALSVRLTGVNKLSYEIAGLDTELVFPFGPNAQMRHRRSKTGPEALKELALFHESRLAVTVNAEFTVDPFGSDAT